MADQSLIDAMARDLWLDDARRVLAERRAMGRVPDDGKDIDPAWYDEDAAMPITGPGFRDRWECQARAALRSILDHGPTPVMRRAFFDAPRLTLDVGGQSMLHSESADIGFRAMIAAELDGGANG